MNGVDCIVFTAGIGENNPQLREDILNGVSFLGVEIDKEKNSQKSDIYEITTNNSKVKAYTIATNEELTIAMDTFEIVENL
jgi:acetate kinase